MSLLLLSLGFTMGTLVSCFHSFSLFLLWPVSGQSGFFILIFIIASEPSGESLLSSGASEAIASATALIMPLLSLSGKRNNSFPWLQKLRIGFLKDKNGQPKHPFLIFIYPLYTLFRQKSRTIQKQLQSID